MVSTSSPASSFVASAPSGSSSLLSAELSRVWAVSRRRCELPTRSTSPRCSSCCAVMPLPLISVPLSPSLGRTTTLPACTSTTQWTRETCRSCSTTSACLGLLPMVTVPTSLGRRKARPMSAPSMTRSRMNVPCGRGAAGADAAAGAEAGGGAEGGGRLLLLFLLLFLRRPQQADTGVGEADGLAGVDLLLDAGLTGRAGRPADDHGLFVQFDLTADAQDAQVVQQHLGPGGVVAEG